jgi:chemotaxis protein MotB
MRRRWDDDEPVEVVRKPRPRAKPRPRSDGGHVNHDRWLVSYSDFITLLFAVFATMYALSAVDAKKFAEIAKSLQQAFQGGIPAKANRQLLVAKPHDPKLGKTTGPGGSIGLGEVREQLTKRLAEAIAANQVAIELDPRGLVISIREAGAFAAASADLSDSAQDILGAVGDALSGIANHVRIEGHTDDVPIHTERYASNWELSTSRATTVVRFLLIRSGLPPERFSAAGYAEYYPRVPNTSPENRARNRRVDIIILTPSTQSSEEPSHPTDASGADSPAAAGAPSPPAPPSH